MGSASSSMSRAWGCGWTPPTRRCATRRMTPSASRAPGRPRWSRFGAASASTLHALGARGYAVQMPLERVAALRGTPGWDAQPEHVVAVMDGRSVWPDAFDPVRQALGGADDGRTVRLVPSTSLMFLPYTVEDEELTRGFQFAREKARTLATWAAALTGGPAPTTTEPPAAVWPAIGELQPRTPRPARRAAQADLDLPPYPTTVSYTHLTLPTIL